jgi:hypothetical protein
MSDGLPVHARASVIASAIPGHTQFAQKFHCMPLWFAAVLRLLLWFRRMRTDPLIRMIGWPSSSSVATSRRSIALSSMRASWQLTLCATSCTRLKAATNSAASPCLTSCGMPFHSFSNPDTCPLPRSHVRSRTADATSRSSSDIARLAPLPFGAGGSRVALQSGHPHPASRDRGWSGPP